MITENDERFLGQGIMVNLYYGLPKDMGERKKQKLEHYAERDLKEFYQFDGWLGGCDLIKTDKDGDSLWCTLTEELMSGGPSVRILITKGTIPQDAVRLLEKLVAWIKEYGDSPSYGWVEPPG